MKMKEQSGYVYTGFQHDEQISAAFDTIDHNILLTRLSCNKES